MFVFACQKKLITITNIIPLIDERVTSYNYGFKIRVRSTNEDE